MTRTTVPPTRPENPGGETPIEDPRRDSVDQIAPPAPGAGQPVEVPVDPDQKPDRHPERGSQTAGAKR